MSNAIMFSPEYPDGLYDFSRYISLLSDDIVRRKCAVLLTAWGHNWAIGVRNNNYNMICDMALSKAIKADPKYWYMAKLQPSYNSRLKDGGFSIFGKLHFAQGRMDWNIGTLKRHLDEMIDRLAKLEQMIVIKTSRIFSKSIEKHIENMRKIIDESQIVANLEGFESMYKSGDLITTLEGESKTATAAAKLEELKESFYKEYEGTPWGLF